MRTLLLAVLVAASLVSAASVAADPSPAAAAVREIEVVVHDGAWHPSRIEVRSGEHVRLRFVRHDYAGCTREVVLGWLGIRRELPTGQPVVIDLPALEPGTYGFECGMGMVRGTIVVAPKEAP